MLTSLIVSAIGLSFAGLDAPPAAAAVPLSFAGMDARPAPAVVRKAVLRQPVDVADFDPDPVPQPAAPTPPAPTSYSLVDSAGWTWTHADRAYLSRFVADRNVAMAPAQVQAPYVMHWSAPVVHVRSAPAGGLFARGLFARRPFAGFGRYARASTYTSGYGAACASGSCWP